MMVSLCVVARNEARFIRSCLASARDVVDEMVVVDTGSNDGTPDLARDAGARVFSRKWPGDLGAAHNLPLGYARGSWVLVLDADEVLDAGAAAAIPRLLQRGAVDGYFTTIRNYVYGQADGGEPVDPADPYAWGAPNYVPTRPVRLFRRRAAFAFTGTLHQTVAGAIQAAGGRLTASGLVIHHYGLLRGDRRKRPLYQALARRQIAATPDDARAWIDFGVTFAHPPFAFEAFRRARALGDRVAAEFLLGMALMALSGARLAVDHLRTAARGTLHRRTPFVTRAEACEQLAAAYEALGRPAAAARAYEQALASCPTSLVAMNDLAALAIERGDLRRARPLLNRLLTQHRGSGVAWATAGLARLHEGDACGAIDALRCALACEPSNVAARVNLGIAYRAAGRSRLASRALASAWEYRGGEAVADLGLGEDLPRPAPPPPLRPLAPGGVISLIDSLSGDAGGVLVDLARALRGRPQVVVCCDSGSYDDHGFRRELDGLQIEVRTLGSVEAVREAVDQCRPEWVVHHWWPSRFSSPYRAGNERWIAVGHAHAPMPTGYDAYVALSASHRRLQGHVPPDRLFSIPNGVRLDRFAAWRSRTTGPVTIAMVSSLVPSKFPRRLLAYLPPLARLGARVLIAGAGGRRFELEPDIAAAGLERHVRFVGSLRSDHIATFLARADIGLHLTEAHEEVCSMAILEMLAAGLPIVTEPKGSLPEQITDGVNGFLAETEHDVSGRLAQLVRDSALRRRMGQASRRVAREYSMEKFAASWRALLASPTRARSRRAIAAVPQVRWEPQLSYLVCDAPGSDALCTALGRTGAAGRPERWFAAHRRRPLETSGLAPRVWLERLVEEHSGPNGVFAAHASLEDLEWVLARLGRAAATRAPVQFQDRLAAAFPHLRIVRIRWNDPLLQAAFAVCLGNPQSRYDRAAIAASRTAVERQEAAWSRALEPASVVPLVIEGEQLLEDGAAAVARLMRRLGIGVARHPWVAHALTIPADRRVGSWARRFRSSDARDAGSVG
jgi:glycosyltransferase involved in cell wall biosynthesis/LPS sulfotransferase NodH/Flp pilus assembly protein TadD